VTNLAIAFNDQLEVVESLHASGHDLTLVRMVEDADAATFTVRRTLGRLTTLASLSPRVFSPPVPLPGNGLTLSRPLPNCLGMRTQRSAGCHAIALFPRLSLATSVVPLTFPP
jgi:hypothetical protein